MLRRELVKNSMVVNAAPGLGAIEAATHQFYAKQKDGTEHLDATAKFTEIWTKASGSWYSFQTAIGLLASPFCSIGSFRH
jgi:hypothetical protein